MEFLNGGDLCSFQKQVQSFQENVAQFYLAEMVLALEYLHDQGIVHRGNPRKQVVPLILLLTHNSSLDMKPGNILITKTGHIKLTDFGLSHLGLNSELSRCPFA